MSQPTYNVLFICTGNSVLPIDKLDKLALNKELSGIGQVKA
jgi:hypothetical protein